MERPLCKDIIIVSDNITEGLEDFDVELAIESEVGVEVQFDPNVTTVKIIEVLDPSIIVANAAQATAESAAEAAASANASTYYTTTMQ